MANSMLDIAVEWLQEISLEATREDGGYVPHILRVESHVVVAGIDHDGEPNLNVFCGEEVVRWRADGLRYRRLDPDESPGQIIVDAEPQQCSCDFSVLHQEALEANQ